MLLFIISVGISTLYYLINGSLSIGKKNLVTQPISLVTSDNHVKKYPFTNRIIN